MMGNVEQAVCKDEAKRGGEGGDHAGGVLEPDLDADEGILSGDPKEERSIAMSPAT
jgi:hypothetical protein